MQSNVVNAGEVERQNENTGPSAKGNCYRDAKAK